MFHIKCEYYIREFNTLDDLIQDVIESGMDPNYEIYENEQPTGQKLIDFINF